jgi:FkbM family methyltransferase
LRPLKEKYLLISVSELKNIYGCNPSGVLHVGAHLCEEKEMYEKFKWLPCYWVEANQALLAAAKSNLNYPSKNHFFYEGVVWEKSGEKIQFNITNNLQSSSVFEMGTHKYLYTDVFVNSVEERTTTTLDELIPVDSFFDFINLDIQGAELNAIKGLGSRLANINWIYTEVNKKKVYKNIYLVTDIDDYLMPYGFKRIATYWLPGAGWGDALYIKEGIFKYSLLRRIKIFYRELKFNYLSEFRPSTLTRLSKKIVRIILRRKST